MWVNLQGCWIPMTLVNSLLFSKLLFTRGANFRTVASPLLCQRRAFYLWPECTTRSPGTAPPCVTAHRGILEPVIVVVVPILPIRVLSLLHSLVSDQWSPSYYSHNSLPPRVGRVILNVHRDMLEYFTFLARGGRGGLGWDAETNAAQTI